MLSKLKEGIPSKWHHDKVETGIFTEHAMFSVGE
jgi:hypothetical protein